MIVGSVSFSRTPTGGVPTVICEAEVPAGTGTLFPVLSMRDEDEDEIVAVVEEKPAPRRRPVARR